MTSYYGTVMRCTQCKTEFLVWQLASTNTLGTQVYTDGFRGGGSYDPGRELVSCPSCDTLYWNNDLLTTKTFHESEYHHDRKLKSVPEAAHSDLNLCLRAFAKQLWKSPEQERYVRTRVWWSSSDPFRDRPDRKHYRSESEQDNIRRLLELVVSGLLAEDLVRAELYRHLGKFDECLTALAPYNSHDASTLALAIRRLATGRNDQVENLQPPRLPG